MKKIVSTLLVVFIMFSLFLSFEFSILAESSYDELWAKKLEYEKDMHVTTGSSENMPNVFYEVNWSFVLYTEQGKKLTYVMEEWAHGGTGNNAELMEIGYLTLTSPELQKIETEAYSTDYNSRIRIRKNSAFRELVKVLQLTKEDVVNAYEKMKSAPESARKLLPFLTDEEFNEFVRYSNQYFACPDEFVLDAVFWKDDAQGNALLCKNGSVYLPEYGGVITTAALFDDGAVSFDADFGGFFDGVDLTTREFRYYYENLKHYVYVQRPSYDEYMYGTVLPKMEYLEAEVARQLAAAETGDRTLTALWIVAIALPALAFVTIQRKRRI